MPLQARTEFAAAINQIASEKGVDTDVIIDAIKQAALAAYRKDLSFRNEAIPDDFEELEAKLDSGTGEISIWRGEENVTPPGFARIAAQTAKQVITQKLHEAEKGAIVDEYDKKVGTVISGAIQRQEGNTYFVDLGRAEGVLPPQEQIRDEYYAPNQRMKFFIKEIRESGRGPEVVVSRTDPGLVKGLFAMEVPEIQSGTVEIREIAREAGGRCKVAVTSNQDGVDPVGSMVGQKGVRVQAVINELGDEKIDIIMHSDVPERFISSALSPAKDVSVTLNEEEKVAKVKIADNQLSLAIGKGGQNVRLAAKLTGWKIDIEGTGEGLEEAPKKEEQPKAEEPKVEEKPAVEVKEPKEEGTHEQKEEDSASDDTQAPATGTTDEGEDEVTGESADKEAVEQVEEEIDKATEEEAVDGKTEPEPTPEEAAPAAAQAEKDMQEDDSADKPEGESEGIAEESEFEKMEEEKAAKEEQVKTDDTATGDEEKS